MQPAMGREKAEGNPAFIQVRGGRLFQNPDVMGPEPNPQRPRESPPRRVSAMDW